MSRTCRFSWRHRDRQICCSRAPRMDQIRSHCYKRPVQHTQVVKSSYQIWFQKLLEDSQGSLRKKEVRPRREILNGWKDRYKYESKVWKRGCRLKGWVWKEGWEYYLFKKEKYVRKGRASMKVKLQWISNIPIRSNAFPPPLEILSERQVLSRPGLRVKAFPSERWEITFNTWQQERLLWIHDNKVNEHLSADLQWN